MEEQKWLLPLEESKVIMAEAMREDFGKFNIVKRMPFCLPFEYRLNLLQKLIESDKHNNNTGFKIQIRRDHIFEDGLYYFRKMSEINLKANVHVYYIDEHGMQEQGIDGGGIFKEFLNDLTKIVFSPDYGLFKIQQQEQQIYPNPASKELLGEDHLIVFHFIGIVVGRAMYDGVLIDTLFSPFFLRKMLGKQNFLTEL